MTRLTYRAYYVRFHLYFVNGPVWATLLSQN